MLDSLRKAHKNYMELIFLKNSFCPAILQNNKSDT